MTPTELGKLFLKTYPANENGYSSIAYVEDLVKINPEYKTKNGCDWARSDCSWLGKRFIIERKKKGNSLFSIQLCGFRSGETNHFIPENVRKELRRKPRVLLGTITNTEIDHKDATYSTSNFQTKDFQVLHKSVNDAKREHCKRCQNTDTRFDARLLSFPSPYIFGNNSLKESGCKGCFWYDIQAFIKEMTKNYVN